MQRDNLPRIFLFPLLYSTFRRIEPVPGMCGQTDHYHALNSPMSHKVTENGYFEEDKYVAKSSQISEKVS